MIEIIPGEKFQEWWECDIDDACSYCDYEADSRAERKFIYAIFGNGKRLLCEKCFHDLPKENQ